MTRQELLAERDKLRVDLEVDSREELEQRFDFWDFASNTEISQAYRLDSLEFALA